MKTLTKLLLAFAILLSSIGHLFAQTNPSNAIVCAGGTATFTTTIPAGHTARWQGYDGKTWVNLSNSPPFSGVTTPTLTVAGCKVNLNGSQYRCTFLIGTVVKSFTAAASLAVNGVSSNPASASICTGGTASFTVAATNTAIYAWQVSTDNGSNYSNITAAGSNPSYANWNTATLAVSNPSVSGWLYRCRVLHKMVIGSDCVDYSTGATLTVLSDPPTINTQPANQSVCSGGTASYSVGVAEAGVTYQWYYSNWVYNNMSGQYEYRFPPLILTNGGNYSGVTTSTLTVANNTYSDHPVKYRCYVTKCNMTSQSSYAYAEIMYPPSISSGLPVSREVCVGGTVPFTVSASGTNLTYQWQVNNGNLANGGSSPSVTGANTANLQLTNVPGSYNGSAFKCIVSGTCPSAATSAVATLTVDSPIADAGTVTPSSNTVCAGTTTSFSINPPAVGQIFRWYVSKNSGTTYDSISTAGSSPAYSGYNAATLQLTNFTSDITNYRYRCVQKNACNTAGTTSTFGSIIVHTPLTLTATPGSITVCENQTAVFTHDANGSVVSRQWYQSSNGGVSWVPVSGTTPSPPTHSGFNTSTLTIGSPVYTNNGLKYKSVITGQAVCTPTSLESPVVTLGVNRRIVIASPLNDTTQSICNGAGTNFKVAAGGTNMQFQWYVKIVGSPDWTPISETGTNPSYTGWNTAVLGLSQVVTNNDFYQYRCTVSTPSPCNESFNSKIFVLHVKVPPGTLNPVSGSAEVCSGGAGSLYSVNSLPTAESYVWNVPAGVTGASNTNTSTLFFPAGSSGDIRVKAVNACGESNEVSKTITVKIPSIQADKIIPSSSIVCPGSSTSLQVQGGSLGTGASWKWYSGSCGGTPLGSGPTLALNNLQTTLKYYVRAEGDCNTTLCSDTTISVLTTSSIQEHPINTTACYADSATFSVLANGPEPLSYKWYKGTTPITGLLPVNKITLRDLTFADQGQYRCLVTSACDATGIQSQSATLTILAQPTLNLGADKHLCPGGKVTLNAGTGYASYLWNNGATTKNIDAAEQGMYSVTVTDANGCWNTDDLYVIEDAPLPPVSLGPDISVCMNTPVVLDASNEYDNFSWSNGSSAQQLNVTSSGTYWVLVGRNSTVCTDIDSVQVHIGKPFDKEKLCIVTVSRSGKNLLVWEKSPDAGIVSYNIYKANSSGDYQVIGNVPVENLSIFIDQNSSPELRCDWYKIAAVDTCKNESPQSPFHKTIHLGVTPASPSGFLLTWDHIEIENSSEVYKQYFIYRGPSYSSLTLIDSISSKTNQYSDLKPPAGKIFYQIAAKKLNSCFPTGSLKSVEEYNSSFSNVKDIEGVSGIEDPAQIGKILVYPNPFTETSKLEFPNPSEKAFYLLVYDLTGKLVRTEGPVKGGEFTLERKNLEKGCYLIEIRGENIFRGRIVIE
jgi:hypothetical protein